jgi:hypothetical protein
MGLPKIPFVVLWEVQHESLKGLLSNEAIGYGLAYVLVRSKEVQWNALYGESSLLLDFFEDDHLHHP